MSKTTNQPCGVCGSTSNHRVFTAHEMMFGTREAFEYMECADCGCVQLLNVPADLSPHYPSEYYAYQQQETGQLKKLVRRVLDPQRAKYALAGGSLVGQLADRVLGTPESFTWLKQTDTTFSDRILDIGCGVGLLLQQLDRMGFEHLTGVDPFLERDLFYRPNFTVWKRELDDLEGTFDLVMMHHVFEHMADPAAVLTAVRRKLDRDGWLLIRIPVASSEAYETYGPDWVALDAPRHLFLHTYESMRRLAEATGFTVEHTKSDAMPLQFIGSEQYRKGIPLMDERSHVKAPNASIFSAAQLADFERRTAELNAQHRGDAAAFYLRRTDAE